MPGFMDVLKQVAAMWQDDRASIVKAGENIMTAIQPMSISNRPVTLASIETLKVEPMHPVDHQPAVYLCKQYSCKKPMTKLSDLESAIH